MNAKSPNSTDEVKSGVKLFMAYMISLGLGLHNLEGLALGSGAAAGQIALTDD